MQVLTVTPKGNYIQVHLVRIGHRLLTGKVFSDNTYGIEFAAIKEDVALLSIVKDAIKQCREASQPIKVDLESGETQFLQNKSTAPTRSVVEERKEWERKQRIGSPITKEKFFDNMHNEGGEGFNPYRID